ncbi:hypothetical protein NG895_19415 [Aeoliella sp. ICT_H6.2]|uniref:Phosphoribosyl-AMP cyclohydrolase n=1 Tax=Aeoliella straminimaris TaxID=2954799 RepID=A0A9X2JHI2_9BACT|nr:hypothetical protein [Aeoliella straminimaris]MCO6046075.1 hypothetical protein [Aeoliella straminimaris]
MMVSIALSKQSVFGATLAMVVLLGCLSPASADSTEQPPITVAEVNAAQQAWCDGLVEISKVHQANGDYRAVATQLIDDLYDYEDGKVFFKPTLAFGKNTFRPTREGAISYFVGGDDSYPEDSGFALNNWTEVTYDNNASENGVQIHGDVAITMGNVYLTDAKGEQAMVDKTFVFRRGSDGKLRLCVHKSSLPFDPAD